MPVKIFELAKEFEAMKPLEIAEFLKNNGFENVKSHMSSLADDEVDKARELLTKKDQPEDDPKKKTKKKTTKKKVAKKKVTKKKVTKKAAAGLEQETSEGDEPKKTTIRKKNVIRRKSR